MSKLDSMPLPTNPRFKSLIGKVFTRLTVTGYAGKQGRCHRWIVRCLCGVEKTVLGVNLTSGGTQSCGCLSSDVTAERSITHGLRGSLAYSSWRSMWDRCANPKHPAYARYKDRAPPEAWKSFQVFFAELGHRPSAQHSLDRIDNEKPYGPGNCRWATCMEQNRNMSTNVWVATADGQSMIQKDACKAVGLWPETVNRRRASGQTLEEASGGLLRETA